MLLPCCLGFVDSNVVIEATKQEKTSTFILSHGVSVLQYQHARQNIPTGSMLSWLLWGNQFYFIKFEYYSKGGVHVWHYNPSQKPMTLKVIGLRVKKNGIAILVNDYVSNCLLKFILNILNINIYIYAYRSWLFSILFWEVVDICQWRDENSDCWELRNNVLSSEWDTKFQRPFSNGVGKSVRTDVEKEHREMVSPECDMDIIIMNSQPLWLSTEELQWTTPANILS